MELPWDFPTNLASHLAEVTSDEVTGLLICEAANKPGAQLETCEISGKRLFMPYEMRGWISIYIYIQVDREIDK